MFARPPHQLSLGRGGKRERDSQGRERMIKDRKSFFYSPPLHTSHSLHHLLFISLHLSAGPGRPLVLAHSYSHIHLQLHLQKSPLHTPALLLPLSRSVWRDHSLLSHPLCLRWAASTWQTRLYICSCQTGRRLHLDYKFHFPSIHPPIHPATTLSISFLEPQSIILDRHECAKMAAYLHVFHLDRPFFFFYFLPIAIYGNFIWVLSIQYWARSCWKACCMVIPAGNCAPST